MPFLFCNAITQGGSLISHCKKRKEKKRKEKKRKEKKRKEKKRKEKKRKVIEAPKSFKKGARKEKSSRFKKRKGKQQNSIQGVSSLSVRVISWCRKEKPMLCGRLPSNR